MMRKTALCLSLLMLFGGLLAVAGEAGKGEKKGQMTHEVTVEVVSIDTAAMTMTFKTEEGEKTAPVMKEAKEALAKVKAGDKVVLTCMDTAEGQHEGITKIKHAEKHG